MKGVSLNVTNNVTIKSVNRKGIIVDERHIHNKATANMVDGILRFLSGEFTPSSVNNYTPSSNLDPSQSAIPYLPTHVGFGYIGYVPNEETSPENYNKDNVGVPSFFDLGLDQPFDNVSRFELSRQRRVSYTDVSNSLAVLYQFYIPVGALVVNYIDDEGNIVYYPWVYDEPQKEGPDRKCTYFTEVGLFSGSSTDSPLLARVTFNGDLSQPESDENRIPLKQYEDTMIVVEWRVGVVSIGEQDKFTTTLVPTNVDTNENNESQEDNSNE